MATARLNLVGEKFSFKVNDNPLIHGLDQKLEVGLKQLVDFLKTDEYRGYVVWNGVWSGVRSMEWGTSYEMGVRRMKSGTWQWRGVEGARPP